MNCCKLIGDNDEKFFVIRKEEGEEISFGRLEKYTPS